MPSIATSAALTEAAKARTRYIVRLKETTNSPVQEVLITKDLKEAEKAADWEVQAGAFDCYIVDQDGNQID